MDSFETITRIGKGACGAVYLVRHTDNKKLLALKKIQLDETRKNRTKEAVLREAKILAQLKHPNIVAYHDSFFDESEEFLCIIQDYCDGGTLEEHINEAARKSKHFEEKQIMQWFIQITMAVQYMHSQKILHRDLKTQNVLLTKTNLTCKLGDFGISRTLDETMDVAKTCVGTPCYLAPEMCQDIPYSSKADVWALGCLLYEMCALHPAFDANNLISLFYKIVKAQYEPIPSQYSSSLSEVLKIILEKNPESRLSARQVLTLPYIQSMLQEFIEEKQSQIELRSEKNSPSNTLDRLSACKQKAKSLGSGTSSRAASSSPRPTRTDKEHDITPDKESSPQYTREACDTESQYLLEVPKVNQKFTCQHCGKTFSMKSWLHKHTVQKHQAFAPPLSARSPTRNISSRQRNELLNADEDDLLNLVTARSKVGYERSPSQDLDEYEDDFENEADIERDTSDIEEKIQAEQDSDDEIPEVLSDSQESEEDDDIYADDFEDEDEELDDLVLHAREARSAAEVSDETIVDEMVSMVISNCKQYLQERCLSTLGKSQVGADGRKPRLHNITEEDIRPEVLHKFGSEHTEACYLLEELLVPDQT